MDDLTSDTPTLSSALSSVGGAVAGRYHVSARLGRGAAKEVYLAYDERLDREVALAIVVGAAGSAEARARVQREARVTGRLGDHPNVITVYDSGEHDGVPYLVLRAMSGGSLAAALERARPPVGDAIRWGREIAAALHHAHAHGIVHRDVKPDNVWLTGDGGAALGDFGVAYAADGERLTAAGTVIGTARYLSPEQARGEEAGPRSDLYALGVTLYELLTGDPPFGGDQGSLLAQHIGAEPEPPSRREPLVAPALERLVLDLLAKDPAQRPASAAAVEHALAAIAAPPGDAARPAQPREAGRRLVTALVVRASTADPEALHGVLTRCAAAVQRRGGSVEGPIGDALIGLFGVRESREDDALRALGAAVELRGSGEPPPRFGIECGDGFVALRADGTPIVTGEAITAATRLAGDAAAGDIVLGASARTAVEGSADVDPASGRLIELRAGAVALRRMSESAFVGRAGELAELRAAFEAVRDEGACRLVTVVGAAGLGKSRLARELIADLGDEATVLIGGCASFGEGLTYRPLAEIVAGLGDDPPARVRELLAGDERAAQHVLSAVGLTDERTQPDETCRAARRLLQALAAQRPLLVVVEDIHWAEPALLDLIEHVGAFSGGSPIMLLCLTRPELLELRPSWAAPQHDRAVIVLQALGEDDARALVGGLGADDRATMIVGRAEGNPLFLEQLVAVEPSAPDETLPTSIQAVLAARIDRLDPGERMVLRHAAIEGRTFHAGGVSALLDPAARRTLDARLVALARKGLIRAQPRALVGGEDAFCFDHALIREAAYHGMPKRSRAVLHAGVADWLQSRTDAAPEIVGYHLETACTLSAELGIDGEREQRLAARAVQRFRSAARAALRRGDSAGAASLLERAVALLTPGDRERAELAPALGAALFAAGRVADAERVLDAAVAEAEDERVRAHARVELGFVRIEADSTGAGGWARAVADDALAVFDRHDDDHGRCRAWSLYALSAWIEGRSALADEAWERAAHSARRAGDDRELFDILAWRASAAAFGPAPVPEAIARCEALRDEVAASAFAVAITQQPLALLHAMAGDVATARRLAAEADAILRDLGNMQSAAGHHVALVELLAGEPAAAERLLHENYDTLARMTGGSLLATTAAMLARAVLAQGRPDEAAELCRVSQRAAPADDIVTHAIWRGVLARALGSAEESEQLARDGVALLADTDLLTHRGDALLDLAAVLRRRGRDADSEAALRSGLACYELKGNAASARLGSRDDLSPTAAVDDA